MEKLAKILAEKSSLSVYPERLFLLAHRLINNTFYKFS